MCFHRTFNSGRCGQQTATTKADLRSGRGNHTTAAGGDHNELAGDIGQPSRGCTPTGERHHSEAPVYGRLDVKAGQVFSRLIRTISSSPGQCLGRLGRPKPIFRRSVEGHRLRELLVDKAVSQQDYDDATAALKQTEADILYWQASSRRPGSIAIHLGQGPHLRPHRQIQRTEGALATAQQPTALATIQRSIPCSWMYPNPQRTCCASAPPGGRSSQSNRGIENRVRLILEDNTRYP